MDWDRFDQGVHMGRGIAGLRLRTKAGIAGKDACLAAVALALVLAAAVPLRAKNVFTRRAIYLTGNAATATGLASVEGLMERSAKAGYNSVWFDNRAMARWYFKDDPKAKQGILQLKGKAKALGLEFCPGSHGQTEPCEETFKHAEAFPVTNTKFVVVGNEARARADTVPTLRNGDFEDTENNRPANWSLHGMAPGNELFADSEVIRPGTAGKVSLRVVIPSWKPVKMVSRQFSLAPGRAYKISVWIKTQNVLKSRDIGIEVRGYGPGGISREIYRNRYARGVAGTQDWRRHSWDFNSLECTTGQIRLSIVDHFTTSGTVWVDDMEIEEVGLYETVRRPTLPITVKSEKGQVFEEGKDYVVKVAEEPKKGDQGHLHIPEGSSITNGQTLRVDWYQLADVRRIVPPAAYCHAGTWESVRRSAEAIFDVFGQAPGWYCKPGEWMGFWDPACTSTYKTAGEYMGGVWTGLVEALRKATQNWNIDVYVIHDMIDPYHNGDRDTYLMTNGTTFGAWKTLHKDAIIMNWNERHKIESLRFFSGLDPKYPDVFFRQVLHFWSGGDVAAETGWLTALDKAEAEGMRDGAVVGIEYATWHAERDGGYDNIEKFAEASAAAGRWAVEDKSWPPAPSVVPKAEKARIQPGLRVISASDQLRFQFVIEQNASVKLELVNAMGRTVRSLHNGILHAGSHETKLDRSSLSAGVYFLTLSQNGMENHLTRKIVLM